MLIALLTPQLDTYKVVRDEQLENTFVKLTQFGKDHALTSIDVREVQCENISLAVVIPETSQLEKFGEVRLVSLKSR